MTRSERIVFLTKQVLEARRAETDARMNRENIEEALLSYQAGIIPDGVIDTAFNIGRQTLGKGFAG